jgi:hypothetical protein
MLNKPNQASALQKSSYMRLRLLYLFPPGRHIVMLCREPRHQFHISVSTRIELVAAFTN